MAHTLITLFLLCWMAPTFAQLDSSLITVSENGSSRATAYTMSSKIIRVGDMTHVTYLGFGERVFIRSLNHQTGVWSKEILIGTAMDNHGAPTLAADSAGFLHIIYGPHHSAFKYRVSLKPNDSSAWSNETYFGLNGTYASIVIDAKDTLHVVYRGGNQGFENLDLMYQNKPFKGDWTQPLVLVDGGNISVSYDSSIALGTEDSLNVGYQFYDHAAAGGRRIGFMKSNTGGKSWTKMDGTPYAIPVTYRSTQVIVDAPLADMRASKVVMDSFGNAFMMINNLQSTPKSSSVVKISTKGVVTILDLKNFLGAGEAFDAYSILTLDSLDRVWMAVPTVKNGDSWGGPSTALKVFRLSSGEFLLNKVELVSTLQSPKRGPEPFWLPVFEHFNGHNTMSESPALLFTKGFGNTTQGLGSTLSTSVILKTDL